MNWGVDQLGLGEVRSIVDLMWPFTGVTLKDREDQSVFRVGWLVG